MIPISTALLGPLILAKGVFGSPWDLFFIFIASFFSYQSLLIRPPLPPLSVSENTGKVLEQGEKRLLILLSHGSSKKLSLQSPEGELHIWV